MKLNLQNRQRTLLIGAGAMVVLLILDSILFTPLTKHWQKRSAENASLEKQVTEGRALIANAPLTRKQWSDMQANALSKEAAQAEQDLITSFDRWGRSVGIELGAIRPQWKRGANERYSLLECRVDATGTVSTLSRFLYEIEKSPLALRVDSVELTARDDNGQKLALGLVVSGLRLAPVEGKL